MCNMSSLHLLEAEMIFFIGLHLPYLSSENDSKVLPTRNSFLTEIDSSALGKGLRLISYTF